MKRFLISLLVLTSCGLGQEIFEPCDPTVVPLQVGTVADDAVSQRMAEIFGKDQSMRMNDISEEDWAEISRVDREHRVEVMVFIKDGKLATGLDFFHAAFVFQHGNCPEHYKLANELANQAVKLGHEEAKWIYAASLDRYLLAIGEKQKFGTQYTSTDGCTYVLEPIDPATTDEERAAYNVPSLEEAIRQAEEFNKDCSH